MRKSTFIALVWSEPGLLYNLAATQHLQPAWGHFQPIQVYPFKLTFDFFWCSAPSVGWFCDHIYYILIINEQLYVKDDNDYYVQQVHYSTLTKEWYQILRRTGRPFFTCPVSTYNEFWNIYNYFNSIKTCSGDSPEGHRMLLIIYASCHLLAMTSVCTNPVMYGFLNENFKQVHNWAYKQIISSSNFG